MNRFGLLSLYRSLTRHWLYAALNIGGLAVGIAVFVVLGLYVRFETSFENWIPHNDEVYTVETVMRHPGPFSGAWPGTMGATLDQMRADFPGVVGTRLRGSAHGFSVLHAGRLTQEDMVQVDPSFFDVIDLPMVRGDGRSALADPANVLISETTARKYFGAANPIGQTMTIVLDGPQPRRVAAVFKDLPNNTDTKISILTRLPDLRSSNNWDHWGSVDLTTYLRFPTPAAARAFEEKMPEFIDRRALRDFGPHASRSMGLTLLPIRRVHLEPQGEHGSSLRQTVVTLGLVGALTLLIAIVNYVNLATARAELRAREVAMRKVLGARRATLVCQFIGEAVVTVGVAVLVGLSLTEVALPFVNATSGLSLKIPYAPAAPFGVLFALVIGAAAGIYPALLISRFPASAVLASARSPGGGRAGALVRDVLVVLQFGLAIAFIIGTFVLVSQTRHVRHTDLGFRREGLLIVPMTDSDIDRAHAQRVVDRLRALPGVTAVGIANQMAGGGGAENSDNFALPGVPGDGPEMRWIAVGHGFFDVYDVKPIAGRLFDDRHGQDNGDHRITTAAPINIVINDRAVPVLGFRSPQDAIGKTVGGDRPRTIIGVVPSLRFFSPRQPNDATAYRYYPNIPFYPTASVRFFGDPKAIMAAARSVWIQTVPQSPFSAELADKRLEKLYEDDDRATRLFSIGAVLAVLIGCVGLWGLASFATSRRVKEIGIRKTLGASSGDILKLLIAQFLRPVLVANLLAWPLAYIAMSRWLAGFDDRIGLSPLYFITGTLLALVIAALTVAAESIRAARATPAWALRRD